ncbi:MAG: MJ1255/VC2487 family glycosyltransferase [Candidatus Woesearchaeota archaeon]
MGKRIKILYSVNGDGLGHASRSTPIIQELLKKYDVKILVGSKRAGDFLRQKFDNVVSYESIKFVYEKNSVNIHKTITKNAKIVLSRSSNLRKVYQTIKGYNPDILLTDCDFPTIVVAKLFKIPLICICNIHAFGEMKFDVPKKYRKTYYIQKMIIKSLSTNIDHHVITTFFYLPVKKTNVILVPPILRKEIQKLKPSRKDYYLVYQTSSTNHRLIKTLKSFNEKFIVYGLDKEGIDGNITFRKTNQKQFFEDFKDCKACIANGGYTFISEAVSLHKPIMCIPIKRTFEQAFNALQIKRLGYGNMCDSINHKTLRDFIKNNNKYYDNLKGYKTENNGKTLKIIEDLINHNIISIKNAKSKK